MQQISASPARALDFLTSQWHNPTSNICSLCTHKTASISGKISIKLRITGPKYLICAFKTFAWPAPSHGGFQHYQALSMLCHDEVKLLLTSYECYFSLPNLHTSTCGGLAMYGFCSEIYFGSSHTSQGIDRQGIQCMMNAYHTSGLDTKPSGDFEPICRKAKISRKSSRSARNISRN